MCKICGISPHFKLYTILVQITIHKWEIYHFKLSPVLGIFHSVRRYAEASSPQVISP